MKAAYPKLTDSGISLLEHPPRRLMIVVCVGFALILWAATSDKPVHIDDTLYVRVAEQMLVSPLDPHGFSINWEGRELPVSVYGSYHLPVWPGLLALAMKLAGTGEVVMHAVQVPFTALALFCISSLAATMGAPVWLTVILFAASPAFMVSATTLMPDVPCLSLFLAACALSFGSRSRPNATGAGLLVLAGFIKLSVIPLLPVVAIGAWSKIRNFRASVAPVLVAALVLAAWPVYTWIHGDHAPAVASLPSWQYTWTIPGIVAKATYALTTLGTAVVHPGTWLLLVFARLGRRHGLLVAGGAVGMAILVVALKAAGAWEGWQPPVWAAPPSRFNLFWAIFGIVGFGTWLAAIAGETILERKRTPRAITRTRIFLLCWIGLAIAGAVAGAPFPGVRYVLLGTPAVVLLVTMDLVSLVHQRRASIVATAVVAGTLWLGTMLTWADYRYATSTRNLTILATAKLTESGVQGWTSAHWGFQYYGERNGLRITGDPNREPRPGDVLMVPQNAFRHGYTPPPGTILKRWITLVWPDEGIPLRSMHSDCSAGFYGSGWMPYTFCGEPVEIISLCRLKEK